MSQLLSTRTKESIKTALSVVIAIAISFYMGWEKPYWAAFAVVMISLDTSGQSLNKAAMRMLGTVVAACAALTLFALFPQSRWGLLAALCLYIGFCAYMVAGDKRRYFWFVTAFVCLVIIIDGSPDPSDIFNIAVARLEETAMGILVYTVVGALLWPTSSRGLLESAAQRLMAAQVELYRQSLALAENDGNLERLRPVKLREIQLLGEFAADLEAAQHDSYEVWEMRHRWRQFHGLSLSLMQTLGQLGDTFVESRHLDLARLLPNLTAVTAEVDARIAEIDRMLRGEAPQRDAEEIAVDVGVAEARALSHFDRAALAAFKSQLDGLEESTRAVFHCVRDIRGFGTSPSSAGEASTPDRGFALDPDRLHASATVVATLCIAFCVWVYVDPPTHSLFVFLPVQWSLASVLTRQNITTMVPGFIVGWLVAGFVYIFVMPHLSGYAELGTMLFLVVFLLFWLFFEPKRRMSRTSALANFFVLISLENQQSYDVANFFNIVAGTALSLGLAVLVQYIPFSPRPEKAFLRVLMRYFRHLEFLLTRLSFDWEQQRTFWGMLQTVIFRLNILRIPVRLAALSDRIDYRFLPGTTREQVRDLAASLQAIAYRINELLDTRETGRSNPLVLELLEDLRDWRLAVRNVVRHWAEDPGAAPPVDIEQRLADRIKAMEIRIGEGRDRVEPAALSQAQYEGLYRIVGAFRALSEAGTTYADLASGIDWRPWKEARF